MLSLSSTPSLPWYRGSTNAVWGVIVPTLLPAAAATGEYSQHFKRRTGAQTGRVCQL